MLFTHILISAALICPPSPASSRLWKLVSGIRWSNKNMIYIALIPQVLHSIVVYYYEEWTAYWIGSISCLWSQAEVTLMWDWLLVPDGNHKLHDSVYDHGFERSSEYAEMMMTS